MVVRQAGRGRWGHWAGFFVPIRTYSRRSDTTPESRSPLISLLEGDRPRTRPGAQYLESSPTTDATPAQRSHDKERRDRGRTLGHPPGQHEPARSLPIADQQGLPPWLFKEQGQTAEPEPAILRRQVTEELRHVMPVELRQLFDNRPQFNARWPESDRHSVSGVAHSGILAAVHNMDPWGEESHRQQRQPSNIRPGSVSRRFKDGFQGLGRRVRLMQSSHATDHFSC